MIFEEGTIEVKENRDIPIYLRKIPLTTPVRIPSRRLGQPDRYEPILISQPVMSLLTGQWTALANLSGMLCLIEVTVKEVA